MNVRRVLPWLAFVVVAGSLVLAAYAPAARGPFVWDDHNLIERDARVTGSAPIAAFFGPFWGDESWVDARTAYFRPLVNLSYAWSWRLSHEPVSFHLSNLLLHLSCILLLALLAYRDGANRATAWVVSLAWGLLPRFTEAVAWIAGRTDVLAAMLGLAAMMIWPNVQDRSWRAELRRAGAAVVMVLALLGKEVAIAVPVALVVADAVADRKRFVASARWPAAGIALYGALRALALKNAPTPRDVLHVSFLTPLEALGHYVQMIVDPWQPRVPIGMRGEIDLAYVALGAGALALTALLFVWTLRDAAKRARLLQPANVRWMVLGVVAIAPVLQILPVRIGGAVVADRFLYLPLAAVAVLVARALAPVSEALVARKSKAIPAIAVATASFVASELVATRARASIFGDELTLWTTTAAQAHPHNTIPLTNLAALPALNERPDLKVQMDTHVTAVLDATGRHATPTYRRARANEMAALADVGKYDEAAAMGRALAAEFPDSAVVAAELGYAELHAEKFAAAREAFTRASTLDPKFADARRMVDVTRQLAAQTDERTAELAATSFPFLSTIGRRIEASDVAMTRALDTTLPDPPRLEALHFAMLFGDVKKARATLDEAAITLENPDATTIAAMEAILKPREALRAEVDRAANAIERLATQPF